MSLPYDHAFTRSWETGVRFRGLVPFPLGSKGGPSTIGHTRKLRAWQRIPTAFFRANSTRSRFFHNLIAERLWLPAMLMMIRQLKEALVGARVGSTR